MGLACGATSPKGLTFSGAYLKGVCWLETRIRKVMGFVVSMLPKPSDGSHVPRLPFQPSRRLAATRRRPVASMARASAAYPLGPRRTLPKDGTGPAMAPFPCQTYSA